VIEAPAQGLSDPDIVRLEIVIEVRAPGKRFDNKLVGALHHRQDNCIGAQDCRHHADIIDWLEALVFNAPPL
jgi:hypothetical protein